MKFYSQYQEDRFLYESGLLPERGVFVEIGASDGVTGSNTKMLEETGWSGLCVDADPRWFEALTKTRKKILQAAVAEYDGITEFYLDGDPTLSGISPPGFHQATKIHVPCLRLDTILDHFQMVPDLISIDTEGTEVDVLNSFDIDFYSPEILIVEYLSQQLDTSERIADYFHEHPRYRMIHRSESNQIWLFQ
ncbi:MAG: FkbM family methyltransferase [Planctomycetaceae bacterium]|nr:FkbM family methyltransferase [Planctomycetaceae bacterium]